jgi:hypothetical protein
VPAFLISLLFNVIVGGQVNLSATNNIHKLPFTTYLSPNYSILFVLLQVLDLFNLEQLAEIAALSLSPGESKDDPVLQLTQLQKEKEIVWGKKTDRLKRKSQKYK